MKLGIVCYPTLGGSGVVATELGGALADRGHEVHLLSYAPPVRLESQGDKIQFHEVEVSSYPLFKYPPYDLALASRLAEVAEDFQLDLVHVHYAIPHALSGLLVQDLLRPRELPLVTTLHGTDITVVGQERSYRRVTCYALRRSNAVTCVSNYLRDQTRREFGVERDIEVIPNFVDGARFHPDRPSPLARTLGPDAGTVLMHISNFRPVKRAMAAIDAFEALQREQPATLIMVGDGPDRPACEQRVRRLGLKPRVRFLGGRSDVENLLPAADVFLLPSEYESFGLAALEAMAAGVVPVATAAGGLPEVIRDGVDGVLVPEAELPMMGRRIAELVAEPGRLTEMKHAARARAVEHFQAEHVVPAYESLYGRLC